MPFLRGNSPKRLAALDRKQEMFSNVGRGRECRPLHVAPLPAFVMVSVICCYYGLLFEKSESIASTGKPEVREYGFGARFRHPVGVAAMSVLVERILPTA